MQPTALMLLMGILGWCVCGRIGGGAIICRSGTDIFVPLSNPRVPWEYSDDVPVCVYDHHPPVLASNSRVYGEQELPLVSPHPTGADPLHQLRVLVDEPSLAEDVGGGVFQLRERKEKVVAVVVVKDVFVASRPRRTET